MTGDAAPWATYTLPLTDGPAPVVAEAPDTRSLPGSMLLKNVQWFCRLRWGVVALLGLLGALALVPHVLERLGLNIEIDWPLAAAGVLAIGNVLFNGHARWLRRSGAVHQARYNLWIQIIFDLLILTAVVHFVGSVGTSAAFAYLFHIVLACIFFSRAASLAVTLLACGLYVACVVAEQSGLLPQAGIYGAALEGEVGLTAKAAVLNVGLAVAIWMAVWYLASRLAAMVRARDRDLAEANERLHRAVNERSEHMLRTTHELKAPFAAIHATTQLLLDGQCGALPDEAAAFIRRIDSRCTRLANEIQEMVQLANLRSESQGALPVGRLDAAALLRWAAGQVRPLADARSVSLETDLQPAPVRGVEDHLRMAFNNLLCNAVAYSHEGGHVRVVCRPADGGARVTIEDHGIGIPEDKLPHIFDEYYRTDEAVRHNKQSSGLGLAIVRHVARTHGIRIRADSRVDVGTTFRLDLPDGSRGGNGELLERETSDGRPDAC
jgi:signal transduction histidine kinase